MLISEISNIIEKNLKNVPQCGAFSMIQKKRLEHKYKNKNKLDYNYN